MSLAAPVAHRREAPLAMVIFGLLMAQQVAAKATRDGVFLSQFSPSALPTMMAVAAIVGLMLSFVEARALVRLGPFRITAASLAISGALHAWEWLLLFSYPRVAACAVYIHVVAFGSIVLSGFWSVMNEAFDPRAAKSTFSRISGFGTLGGLCGGVMADRVAAWFSTSSVFLVLAGLHVVCAALLWRTFSASPAGKAAATSGAPSGEATVLEAIHRYPFLLRLGSLVLAASVGASLLDFVFKAQAVRSLGRGAPLVGFFGLYYTSTSVMVLLVQTFLTRPVIQHAGLAKASAILPGVTAAGSVVALLFPGFHPLIAIRAVEALLRGSIFRSAYELFYTAISPAAKRAVKPVIDVGLDRLGDAVGAGAVGLLLVVAPGSAQPMLAGTCVCSAIAFWMALRLRSGYVQALEESLHHRAIEIDPSMEEDPVTRSVLMRSLVMVKPQDPAPSAPSTRDDRPPTVSDWFIRKAMELRSGDPHRVTAALEKLGPDDWALFPLAIELLAWDPAVPAARAALERAGPRIAGLLVDVLLDPQSDFTIRRRVPRVLAFVPSARSVEGLLAGLEDSRFEVRFYSGRALYLLLSENAELTVPAERVWKVINRELSLQESGAQSHHLLDTRDSQSKEWFFDDLLLDRADRTLEHLFTLLALILPSDAVRIAFRALHTDDRQLRGTAFEYLESATPPGIRHLLLRLLEAGPEPRVRTPSGGALARLRHTELQVNQTLKLPAKPLENRS